MTEYALYIDGVIALSSTNQQQFLTRVETVIQDLASETSTILFRKQVNTQEVTKSNYEKTLELLLNE